MTLLYIAENIISKYRPFCLKLGSANPNDHCPSSIEIDTITDLVEAVDMRIWQLRHLGLSQAPNVFVSGQLPRLQLVLGVLQDVGESQAHDRRVLNL